MSTITQRNSKNGKGLRVHIEKKSLSLQECVYVVRGKGFIYD